MAHMYNGREDLKNMLSHVDFTRLCNAMQKLSEFNLNIVKGGINFPLSLS